VTYWYTVKPIKALSVQHKLPNTETAICKHMNVSLLNTYVKRDDFVCCIKGGPMQRNALDEGCRKVAPYVTGYSPNLKFRD
jgi:hypothetical protein